MRKIEVPNVGRRENEGSLRRQGIVRESVCISKYLRLKSKGRQGV